MAENWIIPCNVKFFDVTEHFKKNNTVVWKNSFTIQEGDQVYIYLSSPYGEIKYKCVVISTDISDQKLKENSYAIPAKKGNNYFSKTEKYIEMKLECEYIPGTFKLAELKSHGLGQVQIQARTSRKLQNYISQMEAGDVVIRGECK